MKATRPGPEPGDSRLARRLRGALAGEVLFDAFSRGRYATDASFYQVEPLGVVVPRSADDLAAALAIAREEGVPVLARGGGTSQAGQTVGRALVLDCSKHLNRLLELDVAGRRATVEPGLVLDRLNARLRREGLFFPVDVSTGNRATLGGMAANNSCGARSLRYGNMVHNVHAIDALLPDGARARFGPLGGNLPALDEQPRYARIVERLTGIATREAEEIAARFPRVQRRVGGYNLDLLPRRGPAGGLEPARLPPEVGAGRAWAGRVGDNLAQILVGSEGTLALFERIELELQPLPAHRVLGVCHFPTFRAAMENTQHLVALDPTAVELVDHSLLGLAREIAIYRPVIEEVVRGAPEALLLVEFAGEDAAEQRARLRQLVELMAELGFPGGVTEVVEPAAQARVWEVRKACLNIAMSMKGDRKPVSFVEDAAVRLEDLADYTERLTAIFRKHGTEGTWYAHASVGTLHVRPILNLKQETDVRALRAIAEEAFAMVRDYKGAHSGEHGDGLVRSEFHEAMFGPRIVRAFEAVKDTFDPEGVMNPGKIVRAPRMDDRTLFRYPPGYAPRPLETALDWSAWGDFAGAVEMCNNNGACRKANPGVMCPSFRVTADERDVTRGRANSLRLALTGQLGPEAFTSEEMRETLALCVSCKGCKRECPTGVDMARMKIEFLAHYTARHGLTPKERLIANLPRYAPLAARLPGLANLRNRVPLLARLGERWLGLSAKRKLPAWRRDRFRDDEATGDSADTKSGRGVALFVDCFNRYFEPENARAALRVLDAAGLGVEIARPTGGGRPLCCGRTLLAAGQVEAARAELRRTLAALAPALERGLPVIGLEPSCLLTFRDELGAILPGAEAARLANAAKLLEEYLAEAQAAGGLELPWAAPETPRRALLHGHCHQKALGAFAPVERLLAAVPGLAVETIESSCCGMAGAFGYDAATYEVSQRMAELSLLPAVRAAGPGDLVIADGTSCRHQIAEGSGRAAVHVARVLAAALDGEAGWARLAPADPTRRTDKRDSHVEQA